MKVKHLLLIFPILLGCNKSKEHKISVVKKNTSPLFKTYTLKSTGKNQYKNFNSPKAINTIASIENEYFNAYPTDTGSRYYGTIWRDNNFNTYLEKDSIPLFDRFLKIRGAKNLQDSMHCTIYAFTGLEAGMGSQISMLDSLHKHIYKKHEYAGWSIGYLLCKYFDWKAYLVLQKNSPEYNQCINHYKKHHSYPVWKQPNIPLSGFYDFDDDKIEIDSLLKQNEFGWGFSYQGYHTWITRYDTLKECYWVGAPSSKFDNINNKKLFLKTKFTDYLDYQSHVIVLPSKK